VVVASETNEGDQLVPFFLGVNAGLLRLESEAGRILPLLAQVAFLTRLDLMHWVQTCTRRGAPSTITRTVWRLGYQRRFFRLLA
jgi:hypothetical protein